MSWLRLTLECRDQHVDALSTLFEQFSAIAISKEALSEEEHYAGVAEDPVYWQLTAVSGLFDESIDLDILLACARNRIGTDNLLGSQVSAVKNTNWVEANRAEHGELLFAERLCVRPEWVEPQRDYPATILLEAGLAFGSGRHDTTSLCLDWLARTGLEGKGVIDYGCGSGVLALAAARLGATPVYAVDIDKQALLATANNAEKNGLEKRIEIWKGEPAELPAVDILVANILLNPLLELAPLFSRLTRPRGQLLLSGILAVQVEECLAAFTPWFKMKEAKFQNEWALLEGTRNTHTAGD